MIPLSLGLKQFDGSILYLYGGTAYVVGAHLVYNYVVVVDIVLI